MYFFPLPQGHGSFRAVFIVVVSFLDRCWLFMKKIVIFVHDKTELEKKLRSLKQSQCPLCGRVETLNRHDSVKTNRPDHASEKHITGKRVWCCNRGQRGGCGRTIKLLFAWALPRHSFTGHILSTLINGIYKGESVKSVFEEMGILLSLDGAYHIIQRLRSQMDMIRSVLSGRGPPPDSEHPDPLIQTIAHLRSVFQSELCPVETFQMTFQRPFMG